MMNRKRCDDAFWVCEAHGTVPLARLRVRSTGNALFRTASAGPHDPPKMPPGFMVMLDGKGSRN